MNALEERGIFWWAGEASGGQGKVPTRHMTGLLKITDSGKISLDCDDFFYPEKDHPKELIMNVEGIYLESKVIFGKLSGKNQNVFLSDLRGFLYRQFYASDCLIGWDDFPAFIIGNPISSMGIHLEGYESWLCLNRVEYQNSDKEISFTYKIPPEDMFKTPNADICITYHPSWSCGTIATLNPSAFFRYVPKTSLSFKEIGRKFRLIEDLFIILTDSEHCLKWPLLTLAQNQKSYTYYFSRNMNNAESSARHECPTNYMLIRQNFAEIFTLWEQKSENLGSAFYSFLSTKRGITLYIEDLFKSLVGGIEAFHRKTVLEQPLEEKLKAKIARIQDQIKSDKDKKWFEQVIRWAHVNEPMLSTRLCKVLTKACPQLDSTKLRNFADICASDRNDLAHYMGQRDSNDNHIFYRRLMNASNALSYIYHALILSDIGVKQEIIDIWFNNSFCAYRIKRALVDANLLDKSVLGLSITHSLNDLRKNDAEN
jgi:hypothetical protein